jgi:hypothetical protein
VADPSHPDAFAVRIGPDGRFAVHGEDGQVVASFDELSTARMFAETERLASLSKSGASPAAFSVVPVGDHFAAIGEKGQVDGGYFATREAAQAHADSRREASARNRPVPAQVPPTPPSLAPQSWARPSSPRPPTPPVPTATPIAPTSPFPASAPTVGVIGPTSPFPASMFPSSIMPAPRPAQPPQAMAPVAIASTPFPASMFPAAPVAAPSRWSGAWPMGMSSPPSPRGGFPSAMFGAAPPNPQGPIGPSGFPAAMYAAPLPVAGPQNRPFGWQPAPPSPPTPPVPGSHGFVGPMPQTNRDLAESIGSAVARATSGLPHATGGKFDWGRIGQGIAKGMEVVAHSSPTSGLSPATIEWAGVGNTIARGFTRTLSAAGGGIEVLTAGFAAARAMGHYAEGLNASNRRFSGFSPAAALAFANLDFGQIGRDVRFGQGTGHTSAALANSVNQARESWQPFDIAATNLSNRVGVFGSGFNTGAGNLASLPSRAFDWAANQVDPTGGLAWTPGKVAFYSFWTTGLTAIGGGLGSIIPGLGTAAGAGIGLGIGLGTSALAELVAPAPAAQDFWGDWARDVRTFRPLLPARLVMPF